MELEKLKQRIEKLRAVDLKYFPKVYESGCVKCNDFRGYIRERLYMLQYASAPVFKVAAQDLLKECDETYGLGLIESETVADSEMRLFTYQLKIIDFLKKNNNVILSVGMGLGKTAAVLHYIDYRMKSRPGLKVLIVAPKRVAETVWLQEAQKWRLNDVCDKIELCVGNKLNRVVSLNSVGKTIKIIGRDNIADVNNIMNDIIFDIVVFDELTSFKNMTAKRTEEALKIQAKQYIGLTGTFVPNGMIDVYGQGAVVKVYTPDVRSFYAWRGFYFRDILQGLKLNFKKYKPTVSMEEILKPIRKNIFTLDSQDYLSIPEISEINHPVRLTDKEQSAYDSLQAFLQFTYNGEIISIDDKAKFTKLQTLCDGFIYDKEGNVIQGGEYSKLSEVVQFVESCKNEYEPVLLFYAYTAEKKYLEENFEKLGISNTDPNDKDFLKKWNNGDVDCLLAHPASAGHGLNLQSGGRIIVWSSITYNYEYFAQSNARLCRTGQKNNVQIHYFFTTNTAEDKVLKAIKEKSKENNEFINITK